ncbi:MAG: translesion error-prone DNA polymerase V autoproteolytic subunit [Candidatus Latescibacteria bacterium]|nr:translesion error-prone DNA polymerase V autoproteolytic subunit [Candidatus Latescibacterota bacterium]
MDLLSFLDSERTLAVIPYEPSAALPIPFFGSTIPAGFPSPAEDYIDKSLDLNDLVIQHPAATFFVRVEGDSMIDAGIHSGDVLVVDRALTPGNGRVVVAVVGGEFTVKRIRKVGDRLFLVPDNPDLDPLEISPETGFEVWGIVTYVIHRVK